MKVLKNIWATLFCVALSMGIASCGDDPEKMEPSPGHTKQQGIEGIWQKLKPDESLSQFTFNSDGTGVYCEGDPGDYDYEQIRYVYDEESNAITIYFYDWTLHCSITELTSKKLTWIEDEEGDRVNTYYKTDKPAQKNDPDGKVDGHEYVDLGLPSGTLWATCNVGASKPEQLGSYFAWGETKAKSDYSWNSYKYCNGSKNSLTKYNSESELGSVVDNKEKLDLEDDAAYVNWGGEWRMPSYSQLKELRGHSTAIWTTENGVYGMKMVSKENGKYIFLPVAGYRVDKDLNNEDYGYYWSCSLGDALSFSSGMTNMTSSNRYCGLSVRPVWQEIVKAKSITLDKSTLSFVENDTYNNTYTLSATISPSNATDKSVTWSSSNPSVATVSDYGRVTAVKAGTATIKVKANDGSGVSATCSVTVEIQKKNYGHVYVDLGLSVKWATCNVGASSPEEYGDYYAWGETKAYGESDTSNSMNYSHAGTYTKTYYDWSTYKWCDGSETTQTKYCTDSNYGTVDNKKVLESSDDVAHVKWDGSWRMPTDEEMTELRENCTWTWTTQGGKNGYKVTSKKNGNSIFLPAAGDRNGSSLFSAGSDGSYWSSSLNESYPYNANFVGFHSSRVYRSHYYRFVGHSVRPVCDIE